MRALKSDLWESPLLKCGGLQTSLDRGLVEYGLDWLPQERDALGQEYNQWVLFRANLKFSTAQRWVFWLSSQLWHQFTQNDRFGDLTTNCLELHICVLIYFEPSMVAHASNSYFQEAGWGRIMANSRLQCEILLSSSPVFPILKKWWAGAW